MKRKKMDNRLGYKREISWNCNKWHKQKNLENVKSDWKSDSLSIIQKKTTNSRKQFKNKLISKKQK